MSFQSMRGRTVYIGTQNGLGVLAFSDGTQQVTAYQGDSSGGIIQNQVTITNSTNSTSVVISAGQDSDGNLIDDSIYYTALNSTETSPTLTHNFVGSTVNLDTTLNVAGTASFNNELIVSGATTLASSLNVLGTTTVGTTSTESSTMLNIYGEVYQYLPNDNTQYGYQSLGGLSGSSNTAIGAASLQVNTGNNNCAVGDYSLTANTTGSQNTAVGHLGLMYNTEGYSNTSVGNTALQNNTEGYSNTSVGDNALQNNTIGYYNTCLGAESGYNITDGISNTCVGYNSGASISEGNYNTCLGVNSNITDGATGSTVIGYGATTPISNQIVLGTESNSVSIPGALTVTATTTLETLFAGDTNLDSLTVSDTTTLDTLTVTGETNLDTLTVTGATTLESTLNVDSSLSVFGTSTFTSGFLCGNQTTAYIMLIGTASVAYGSSALDSYASDSQSTNVVSVCTFNNSLSFPSSIVGGYVNTNYQYIWASFISGVTGTTNQINVSFVNFGQATDYLPSTVSFICWGN